MTPINLSIKQINEIRDNLSEETAVHVLDLIQSLSKRNVDNKAKIYNLEEAAGAQLSKVNVLLHAKVLNEETMKKQGDRILELTAANLELKRQYSQLEENNRYYNKANHDKVLTYGVKIEVLRGIIKDIVNDKVRG